MIWLLYACLFNNKLDYSTSVSLLIVHKCINFIVSLYWQNKMLQAKAVLYLNMFKWQITCHITTLENVSNILGWNLTQIIIAFNQKRTMFMKLNCLYPNMLLTFLQYFKMIYIVRWPMHLFFFKLKYLHLQVHVWNKQLLKQNFRKDQSLRTVSYQIVIVML